jgi:O-acetylhomoserine/O-acetylserine sulfhydrylase-like pyridoxal-dependent enzyme
MNAISFLYMTAGIVITICDNTVATAALFNPIKWGVDVVVHSTSKYTNGQGTAIGGIVVERDGLAEFFKANSKRYYHFTTPDESYHGLGITDFETLDIKATSDAKFLLMEIPMEH